MTTAWQLETTTDHWQLEESSDIWLLEAYQTGAYAAEVQADNPVAWYRMEETSGLIQDSSGNDNHATSSGGTAQYSQSSPITAEAGQNSIYIDNDPTYFLIPDDATLDVADVFTLEAWIKRPNTTDTGAGQIATKGGTLGGATASWGFQFDATNQRIDFNIADSVFLATTGPTGTITDTAWHHVVATKSTTTIHLYIDSVEHSNVFSTTAIPDNNTAMEIGATVTSSFGTFPINLYVDEFAYYNTALSAARVLAHYDAAFSTVTDQPFPILGGGYYPQGG